MFKGLFRFVCRSLFFLILWNVAVTPADAGQVENHLTIREAEGVTSQNCPIQIARPFVQGEIRDFPQILLNGVPVTTQADVKQRHPDGSVRHAVLSFLIPTLAAGSSVKATFQNQATGLNGQRLSQPEMLAGDFDFEARMTLTQGTGLSASGRQMLADGCFEYWLAGPVATSVILTDHSVNRAYDLGFERRALAKLTADANKTATSLAVDNITGFQAGDFIEVQALWGASEFMTVAAVDAAAKIITIGARAQKGTSALDHYKGQFVAADAWQATTNPTYKSFRPIIHATFWPAIQQVRVRFIGELGNTESYQDLIYALDLYTGLGSPRHNYTKAAFTHYAGSRWTKEFWLNGYRPPRVSIDHNLAYLKETRLVPNYDTTKIVPESELAARYAAWLGKAKDINDPGWWTPAMFATGGRPEIGPYPTWTVHWLYTGDLRMAEIALKQAELCGAWSYHWREGNPTKYLDQDLTVPGLGHVMSPSSRPTIKAGSWTDYNIRAQDNIKIVGQYTTGPWSWDSAHQADMASVQYLLTGDFWFLEEMYFLAGMGVTSTHGYHFNTYGGRGPTGKEGGIYNDGQTRSQAWVFRNRIHTHAVAPDAHPEKAWLGRLINDAVAIWEGARNLTGSAFEGTPLWLWGQNTYATYFGRDIYNQPLGPPPLHYWMTGNAGSIDSNMDKTVTYAADSPWMIHFVMFALGRAEELGYPAGLLRRYLGEFVTGELTDPGYNPYLTDAYRLPTRRVSDRGYFQTWAELRTGFLQTYVDGAQSRFLSGTGIGDTEHGYPNITLAAASYVKDLPNGNPAWAFMEQNVLSNPLLNRNPKWALVPRPLSSTCPLDSDQDGDVDGKDLAAFAGGFNGTCLGEMASAFGH